MMIYRSFYFFFPIRPENQPEKKLEKSI